MGRRVSLIPALLLLAMAGPLAAEPADSLPPGKPGPAALAAEPADSLPPGKPGPAALPAKPADSSPPGKPGPVSGEGPHPLPAEQNPPAVDLSRITWRDSVASAPAGSGQDVVLTLELGLQRAAERLLARARPIEGAIVVVDVETGHVLVWAGRSPGGASTVLLQAKAPAASLFKIVTTAALLEKTPVTPATEVCTSGGEHGIYRRHLEPPRESNATCASFFHALGLSKNAVYAQLATRHLMRSHLVEMGIRFGFNRPVPFDVRVPMGSLDVPYNDLEFARTAAGFRNSTLSPLGAAYLAYVVASRGRPRPLRIVDWADDSSSPARAEPAHRVIRRLTAARLARMMEVTVHGGTSLEAFTNGRGQSHLGPLRVAGKTGTLQVERGGPTTSWFVGFAPSRRPALVVSVLLQNGRVWHQKANEVARDVLRVYFAARGVRGVTNPFAS